MAPNIGSPTRKSEPYTATRGQWSWLHSSIALWVWLWFKNSRMKTEKQVCSKSAPSCLAHDKLPWLPCCQILKESTIFMFHPLSYSNLPCHSAMPHCGRTPPSPFFLILCINAEPGKLPFFTFPIKPSLIYIGQNLRKQSGSFFFLNI